MKYDDYGTLKHCAESLNRISIGFSTVADHDNARRVSKVACDLLKFLDTVKVEPDDDFDEE
jgi:hypothetical protein